MVSLRLKAASSNKCGRSGNMAFLTSGRDPLLDSSMAEALEKRGKELVGLILLALGTATAMMIFSYHPDDPSWLSATEEPARNLLGQPGASLAAPLHLILGWGVWGLAAVFLVWGFRFTLHFSEDRAIGRLVFAPIWIASLSLYASTLPPVASWVQMHDTFGVGGLFGEMVQGMLLNILPIEADIGLKLLSALFFMVALGLGLFVLGFNFNEVVRFARLCLLGVVLAFDKLVSFAGGAAQGATRSAQHITFRPSPGLENGDFDADEEEPDSDYPPEPQIYRSSDTGGDLNQLEEGEANEIKPENAGRLKGAGGLLNQMSSIMRRSNGEIESGEPVAASDQTIEERVHNRIADVIRKRTGRDFTQEDPNGRTATRPVPLVVAATHATELPLEPPLTAASLENGVNDQFEDEMGDMLDDVAPVETENAPPLNIPRAKPRKVVQHALRRQAKPSARAMEEAQPSLEFESKSKNEYESPPLGLLLNPVKIQRHHLSDEALEENARMLENVLDDYGVKGDIVSVRPGPVVTMYELEPAPGLKASRVMGLADDIARSMSALSARVSTVPGRTVIGIELPNDNREMVVLREILSTRDFGDGSQKLPLALGKDIGGDPVVSDLARMPHLLIAGTTGSGKSVAINTMILSLLYKLTPEECRLIMIDPKMLELSVYDGIPHLLSPVVTDPKKAVVALKWVVAEMEERYRKMSKMGVRNIDGYNGRVAEAVSGGKIFSRTVQTGFDDETGEPEYVTEEIEPEMMPYIVVIVDEMADLMMVAGKEIEACIQRLAQMARASGIHIVMATQRPSVDVITGTIKANFPTRISFQVTSKVDSRTILGEMGAEQLLGSGDMLYMAGGGKITRCHGPFVGDEEVEEVVRHLKAFGPPEYVAGVQEGPEEDKAGNIDAVLGLGDGGDGEDALYDQAVAIVLQDRKCSTSYIQRKLSIGYNKAARIVEQMEENGVVSSANHVGRRDILVPEQ